MSNEKFLEQFKPVEPETYEFYDFFLKFLAYYDFVACEKSQKFTTGRLFC